MANLWRISRDSRLSHLWNGSVPTKEGRFRLIIQCLCSLKHVGGLSSLTISGTAGRLKFDWGSWTLGAAAAGWQAVAAASEARVVGVWIEGLS